MQDRRHRPPQHLWEKKAEVSAEMELLLLCTRWPQRRLEDYELIRQRCAEPLNWREFVHLVRHHRVTPLVNRNLQSSGAQSNSPAFRWAAAELQRLSGLNAHRTLRSLAELRRVVGALQSLDIPVRVLKGIPLAKMAFGDLALRTPGDLDLLVPERGIQQADRILGEFGYKGIVDLRRLSPKRLAFYRAHWKDMAYENSEAGLFLDLHWRCFRNREMPGSNLCSMSSGETVSFGTFHVSTLPPAEGLLYLCVHGTLDGWLYLKSLVDVAAQLRCMDELELERLAELAAGHGILPELSATLLLVRRYWGTNHWSGHLLQPNEPTVKTILRYVDRNHSEAGYLADRNTIPIARTLAFEFNLRKGYKYRRELLIRVLFRSRMWDAVTLPDWLFWLYPILSPVEWVLFRLRRARAKQRVGASGGAKDERNLEAKRLR